MRVIAGTARGIQLKTIEGDKTRPTTDRVKEAVFSMLHHKLWDCTALDLFSGSGAIGIEMISRGAKQVDLVESNKALKPIIEDNLKRTKCDANAFVMIADVYVALKQFKPLSYDLIYMDPPYLSGDIIKVLDLVQQRELLRPEGWLVIEHDIKETFIHSLNPYFYTIKTKKYGKIGVSVIGRSNENSGLSR